MRIALRLGAVLAIGAFAGWMTRPSAPAPTSTSVPRAAPVVRTAAVRPPPAIRSHVPQRELSVTDRRYDPVARLHEEPPGSLLPREIFEAEPRDPVHAPVLEGRIRGRVTRLLDELGLAARVRSIEAECKTLSCTTVLELAPAEVVAVYDLVNGVMLGDSQSPSYEQQQGTITITSLYRSESRDEATNARFETLAFEPSLVVAKMRQRGEVGGAAGDPKEPP